jgi:hypothetical protein
VEVAGRASVRVKPGQRKLVVLIGALHIGATANRAGALVERDEGRVAGFAFGRLERNERPARKRLTKSRLQDDQNISALQVLAAAQQALNLSGRGSSPRRCTKIFGVLVSMQHSRLLSGRVVGSSPRRSTNIIDGDQRPQSSRQRKT